VGPATLAKLERLGVHRVGDLAALPLDAVTAALGTAHGTHLHRLANGVDPREVEPHRQPKSIGHEETFARDLHDREALEREAVRMSDAVAARLRRHDLRGRTVTIKVRFDDFRTITRSVTLPEAVDSGSIVLREARALLAPLDPAPGVRLFGVSVSGLGPAGPRQLSLGLDDGSGPDAGSPVGGTGALAGEWVEADGAVDRIRERFGEDVIGPATLMGADGLRRKQRGDQQWGPDAGRGPDPHLPPPPGR
jgi:DNA polymerase-4